MRDFSFIRTHHENTYVVFDINNNHRSPSRTYIPFSVCVSRPPLFSPRLCMHITISVYVYVYVMLCVRMYAEAWKGSQTRESSFCFPLTYVSNVCIYMLAFVQLLHLFEYVQFN